MPKKMSMKCHLISLGGSQSGCAAYFCTNPALSLCCGGLWLGASAGAGGQGGAVIMHLKAHGAVRMCQALVYTISTWINSLDLWQPS